MRIWEEIMTQTTGNWNVSDLLRSPLQSTVSWEKNLEELHILNDHVECDRSAPQTTILGTAITCSAIGWSMSRKASIGLSTICGTSASIICTMGATRTRSVKCSTMCRWTRSCGRTGRAPGPRAALCVCLRGALCAASALSVFCACRP